MARNVLKLRISGHEQNPDTIRNRLNELKTKLESESRTVTRKETGPKDLLMRPLANKAFWEKMRSRLKEELDKNPVTIENYFSHFADEKGAINLADLGPEEMCQKTMNYVQNLIGRAIKETEYTDGRPDFWDLLQYVDSTDLAREVAHGRHDYMFCPEQYLR